MTALAWQTLLILGIAYLAGCILGCFSRKILSSQQAETVDAVRIPPLAKEVVAPPVPHVASGAEFRRAEFDRPPATPVSTRNAERFERALTGGAPVQTPQPIPTPARIAPVTPQPIATPRVAPAASAADASALAAAAAVLAAGKAKEAAVTPAPAAERALDDLTLIRLIDKPLEAELRRAGVKSYGEIAAWSSADVKRFSQMLGFRARIQQENWIEQAQILARGGLTSYAQRKLRGEIASARPIRDEGDPRRSVVAAVTANRVAAPQPAVAREASAPDVAARAAFGGSRPGAAAPVTPSTVHARDALQRIAGISAEVETALNAHGINRYSQIGSWTAADVERYELQLGCSGRVVRENWIEQARILARHGDTAYSRDQDRRATAPPMPALKPATPASATFSEEAIPSSTRRTTELVGLRSVRSEALRGDTTAEPAALRSGRASEPDDLKRIRGVGVLIEKKLHALGVASFQQIANWTADEVALFSEKLDFKGRIERENWIEQARILSSGGQTEFSRRVDRGALDY